MKKMTAYQLANKLGVSHQTVYNWIEKGLPHVYEKEGRSMTIRLDIDEVKLWLKENQGKLVK
jgi:excisionase family DNA binding protein